jgi:hypothetical protein
MNTLKNVYDKLADKTELAKHEVELGLIDDYKSLFSKAINAYGIADNQIKELKNNSKNIIGLFDNAKERFATLSVSYQVIEKTSKDLGVQLPNEIINNHKSMLDYFKKIDGAIKLLNSIK